MKYFVVLLVLIGFIGIAHGQYIGDKIPPGTMMSMTTGEYTFSPSYVDFYYSGSHFKKYSIIAEQYRYDIPYMISNGTISKMSMDCSSVELGLDVEPSGKQGWITLALPRQLIDSKMRDGQDDDFFVLRDSKEIQRSDVAAEKLRLLLIPFTNDTSHVNVIGVNYPEHVGKNTCNGNNEPPFSFLLRPLEQTQSGIPFNDIQCKENMVLIQKYDDSPACVTFSTKQKLLERRWTESPSYEIIGLDKAYVGEPIKISIHMLGWDTCNNYSAAIYNSTNSEMWRYQSSNSCVSIDPSRLHTSTIDIPRNKKYPVIETTGNYVFKIKIGPTVLEEEFFVKNLLSKPSQNTIDLFCGPSLEQIRSDAPIDILTPHELPSGYSLRSTDNNHSGIILLNYARGNTCGNDADTLEDGKVEIVIVFSPDAPLDNDGEKFLEQYQDKYRKNSISYQIDVVDDRLYMIGTAGTTKPVLSGSDNHTYEEKFTEPARVYVFDADNAAGYKLSAYLPLYDVMRMARSLE